MSRNVTNTVLHYIITWEWFQNELPQTYYATETAYPESGAACHSEGR